MFSKRIPLILSVGILLVLVVALSICNYLENSNQIVYALDDAYIHMAVAKHFSQHGVWGITQYGFTSANSSLLYPLILSAIYFVFGVNTIAPLLLNILFAALFIFLIYQLLHHDFSIIAFIFFIPLPLLIFTGMEHTLQILIVILFVYHASQSLEKNDKNAWLLALAMLVTLSRYEGLFLLLIVSTLFALRKRFLFALTLLLSGSLPIVIYGWISISKGWYFFPNSLIVKTKMPELTFNCFLFYIARCVENLVSSPEMMALLLVSLILVIVQYQKKPVWSNLILMLGIFITTTILHMTFSRVDGFYRYEAYLIALGLLVVILNLQNCELKKTSIVLLCFILFLPLTIRGVQSLRAAYLAPHQRYLEHILPAFFIKQYYPTSTIVVNDVGAMGFFTDAKILDIWALASMEPMHMMNEGFNKKQLQTWAANNDAVLAYVLIQRISVSARIPAQWKKVAQWEMSRNEVFNDTQFAWFAVDPKEEKNLKKHLQDYSKNLPSDLRYS